MNDHDRFFTLADDSGWDVAKEGFVERAFTAGPDHHQIVIHGLVDDA